MQPHHLLLVNHELQGLTYGWDENSENNLMARKNSKLTDAIDGVFFSIKNISKQHLNGYRSLLLTS